MNSLVKPLVVAWFTTLLTPSVVNANDDVQQKCSELIYIDCDTKKWESNNEIIKISKCSYKTIKIDNWVWHIWEFIVEIDNKEGKVYAYIPDSDSEKSVSHLINKWEWKCKIWKTKSL